MHFSESGWSPAFFVTFVIIISRIFPENFIEIPKNFSEDMKIFFFDINYFGQFFEFFDISCYKEINNVSI